MVLDAILGRSVSVSLYERYAETRLEGCVLSFLSWRSFFPVFLTQYPELCRGGRLFVGAPFHSQELIVPALAYFFRAWLDFACLAKVIVEERAPPWPCFYAATASISPLFPSLAF